MTILSVKAQTSERGIVDIDLVKDCPECGGGGRKAYAIDGPIANVVKDCPRCNGSGKVPRYITPEIFEEITGDKVPDDQPVWYLISACLENDFNAKWEIEAYSSAQDWFNDFDGGSHCVLAFGQPAPDANWRPE